MSCERLSPRDPVVVKKLSTLSHGRARVRRRCPYAEHVLCVPGEDAALTAGPFAEKTRDDISTYERGGT